MDEPEFAVEPEEKKILDLEIKSWGKAYIYKVRANNMRKCSGQIQKPI